MKKKLFFLIFYSVTVMADDNIPLDALKTCLYQHSSTKGITYSEIDTSEMITDDSYSKFGAARYVEYNGVSVGYGEYRHGMAFYRETVAYPLSMSKVVGVGLPIKGTPKDIDYMISEWGSVKFKKREFICVNVPFSGVGQSGEHQNIRNVFVYDAKGKEIYYTVGDVSNKAQ